MSKCSCNSCATSRWWTKLKESGSREEIVEFTQERLDYYLEGEEYQADRLAAALGVISVYKDENAKLKQVLATREAK